MEWTIRPPWRPLLLSQQRLGEILARDLAISAEVLQEALTRAARERVRLGEALVALGAVTADDVLRALAAQQDLPYLSARGAALDAARAQERSRPSTCASTWPARSPSRAASLTVATADPPNPPSARRPAADASG